MSPIKTIRHGIRQAEMEAAMLPLKKTDVVPKSEVVNNIAFTIFGQHDELTDEYGNTNTDGFPLLYDTQDDSGKITPSYLLPNAFARVAMGKKVRYFIKTNSLGKHYDPIGMFSENRHNKVLKHAGKKEWEWKEVPHTVFIFYLKYLKSRNKAWLINSERENF